MTHVNDLQRRVRRQGKWVPLVGNWPIPYRCDIDSETLHFRYEPHPKVCRVPVDIHRRFAQLTSDPVSNPERLDKRTLNRIRKFAEAYGPLEVDKLVGASEQTAKWVEYSTLARHLLKAGTSHIRFNEVGEALWWDTLKRWIPKVLFEAAFRGRKNVKPGREERDAVGRQIILLLALRSWLNITGAFEPGVQWVGCRSNPLMGRSLQIRPIAGALLGAIGLQIAAELTGSDNLRTECSGCGTLIAATERAPSRGSRRFCQGCRDSKVPEKLAARDFRERQSRTK